MFGHIPFDAAGGAPAAHAGPPLLLPRGSPSYLKEVPKVLAPLGSSFCVSAPLSGALTLVLDVWALGDDGARVSTPVVFPSEGGQSCFACMSELGQGEEGQRDPVPSSISWALKQHMCA